MNRRHLLLCLAALPLLAHAQGYKEPTKAQPELPREPLTIATQDGRKLAFSVEMALSADQQTTGLMFRTVVAPDGGMLFDWGQEKPSQMWMENTLVPLDMVFIRADGMISHIAEDTVPHSRAVIDSGGAVRATLELAAGTTARQNIRVGDRVLQKIFGDA